jgi:hypothetical protein
MYRIPAAQNVSDSSSPRRGEVDIVFGDYKQDVLRDGRTLPSPDSTTLSRLLSGVEGAARFWSPEMKSPVWSSPLRLCAKRRMEGGKGEVRLFPGTQFYLTRAARDLSISPAAHGEVMVLLGVGS